MILLYHKVYLENLSPYWVNVDNFYRHMYEISNKEIVYLDDYDVMNSNQVVITFDGVYRNILEFAAPILKKHGYPFELFITGDYVGRNNQFDIKEPEAAFASASDLKKLVEYGGRLQWHTNSHQDMSNLNDIEIIQREISIPQHLLSLDPYGFKWFAYPHGSFSTTVLSEVKKYFIGALSCNQGNDYDLYKLNRITMTNESKFDDNSVSVIIPSYNYGAYLVEAIESVLRQTILPDEIVIMDDCSNDSTQEIGNYYEKKYPNLINYHRNESNLGIVKNFNKAVSLTSSKYIVFLGADNRFVSNYIEETKNTLSSSDKVGIAYTDFALFGPRARLIYESYGQDLKGENKNNFYIIKFPSWDKYSQERIKKANFIHGSSMYKRKAYEDAGGYMERSKEAEDHSLFLRMINHGWIAKKADKTLLEYRQHSSEQANMMRATYSQLVFYKEKCKQLEDEKKKLSTMLCYKILIPLILYEKSIYIIKKYGFKEFIVRGIKFIKNILA